MSIEYTYQIVKVDEAARCMEIVYSSPGHQTMHIGTRLPYAGETLDSVIAAFAPIAFWEDAKRAVVLPKVGATGVVSPMTAATSSSAQPVFSVREVAV